MEKSGFFLFAHVPHEVLNHLMNYEVGTYYNPPHFQYARFSAFGITKVINLQIILTLCLIT